MYLSLNVLLFFSCIADLNGVCTLLYVASSFNFILIYFKKTFLLYLQISAVLAAWQACSFSMLHLTWSDLTCCDLI